MIAQSKKTARGPRSRQQQLNSERIGPACTKVPLPAMHHPAAFNTLKYLCSKLLAVTN